MDLRLGTSEYADTPVESPRAEVRFGLVLYGGVSLAIYIYGVVFEFWRLVRASEGVEENAYTALLAETETTAAVDIVSGTSAGGINGILLAKALTTGADLEKVRRIWVKDANLKDLLRDRKDTDARSLLRTDYFEDLLTDGLARMDTSAGDAKGLVKAFDLFISSTRLQPWIRDFPTDLDGKITSADYRKLFQLKYRVADYNPRNPDVGYEHSDFSAEANENLVAIARATSAFPGAFEPRLITHEKGDPLYSTSEPESSYFSDGGILHNKPFTETISTIIARANDRPVDRWLVSVEPDPEEFKDEVVTEPPLDEVIGKAAIGIPRYQSIAGDLDRLIQHRQQSRRENNRLQSIDASLDSTRVATGATIADLRDQFAASPAYPPYRIERSYQLNSDLAYAIAEAAGLGEVQAELIRDGLQAAAQEFEDPEPPADEIDGGDEPAAPTQQGVPDYSFERRRLYQVLGRAIDIVGHLEAPFDAMVRDQIQTLWASYDGIGAALWSVLRGGGDDDGGGGGALALAGLDGDQLQSGAIGLIPALYDALYPLVPGELVNPDAPHRPAVLACQRLDYAVAGSQVEAPAVRFWDLYRNFSLWDQYLLPTDPHLGVTPRGTINLARISPEDPDHLDVSAEDKLAGDALFHFGGFLREEWRRNDIRWGRFDAAEMIVRMLVKGRSVAPAAVEAHIEAAQKEIFAKEFPNVQGDYKQYLENDYHVGEEGPDVIPMQERASLVVRTSDVVRNMIGKLGDKEGGSRFAGVYNWIGVALAWLLAIVRWPVLAIWGDDPAWRRVASIGVLFIGGWTAVTLVFVLTNVIDPSAALWGWIEIGAAIFATWTLLNAVFIFGLKLTAVLWGLFVVAVIVGLIFCLT